jgi:hypothetical protein
MVEHCLASTRARVQTLVLPERKKERKEGREGGRDGGKKWTETDINIKRHFCTS